MNDKLENALADVIEKANNGIDSASDFIMSELPDVVQQALTWYAIESGIYSVLGLLVIISSVFMVKLCHKFCKSCDGYGIGEYGEPFFFIYVIPIAAAVFGLVIMSLDWLKIWIAPKLWLIEYAAKLAG